MSLQTVVSGDELCGLLRSRHPGAGKSVEVDQSLSKTAVRLRLIEEAGPQLKKEASPP
jgi:hypothetical protein